MLSLIIISALMLCFLIVVAVHVHRKEEAAEAAEPELLPQVDRDTAARKEWEAAFPDWWDYVPLPLVLDGQRPESPLASAARMAKAQARVDRLMIRNSDPYNLIEDLALMGLHSLDFCTCQPCNQLRRRYYANKRLDSGSV